MENSLTYLGRTYNDNEIISGSFSRTQSLSIAELPVDTMEITVRPNLHLDFFTNEPYPLFTRDGLRFQTSEANPISGQFQQNTPLIQRADGSQTAIWYMQSVERIGKDVYKLNGFSSLGRLTQITHYGGIYTGQTVATVAASIIGDLPYYISAEFQNIAVYGWLPIATARDNLQQLLFAINANLRTDAQGVLRIQSLSTAEQSTIAESDIFQSGASVKYNSPVTKVVVVEHQYSVGTGTKELFNGTATENQLITFDEPMSNLSASGLSIVEAGDNYAVVSGTGTLTGTPYIHTMREIERTVSIANVNNIVRVENATLVGITASSDVANRLAEYYKCRNSINAAVAQAFIGVGSVVSMFDPYDEIMRSACVESERVNLSHTAKSTVSALVGYIPWQVVPFEDVRELLTGIGMWTAPSDIPPGTEAKVVLIGGGQGGGKGNAGESAPAFRQYSDSGSGPSYDPNYQRVYTINNAGGKGGAPGTPGDGGKIYRTTIRVSPGDTIPYTCGVGGAGELYSESAGGSAGTDTTFGAFSSANGSSSSSGYQDPVSQTAFAKMGNSGIAGGDGVGYVDGQLVTPPDIIVDGVTYSAGGRASTEQETASGGNSRYAPGWWGRWGEYGYGGGNAYKANGGIANSAPYGTISSSTSDVFAAPASGGAGATAQAPSAAVVYGQGGAGGNGGGGGGAFGIARAEVRWGYGLSSHGTARLTSSHYWPAPGGAGSGGGAGAPGCIILYYRRPVTE